jgi:hypothetical protein
MFNSPAFTTYYFSRRVIIMEGSVELLNFIYQNSQMGAMTTKQLIRTSEDKEFKKHLGEQFYKYQEINSDAKRMLNEKGYDEEGISRFEKLKTYFAVNMHTLTDKSTSHIAEMLITGSNMGVIDGIRKLKRYQDAEPEIRNLMENLIGLEENNRQDLKQYLS